MRIAVDAKLLSSPLTGIGRYTRALLDYMIPAGHQWFLYSDRPIEPIHAGNPRVSIRHGDARKGSPGGLWWTQWKYNRWAVQDVADLFWSPRHHLPLYLPDSMPRVVTIHDMVWRQFPETMPVGRYWLERCLMGPSISLADQVICVSKFTASEVTRHYPAALGKCRVIYEAADELAEAGVMPEWVPSQYLLFVGTPEPRKNLSRLLSAYAVLRDDPDVPPLVIAGGGGWGGVDLLATVTALGLDGRVVLPGYVSDAELQALYGRARCLIMPSLYEGFGLPVLEAMRHGVPVIASSTGALPEVVGDAGLLVSPYAERELTDAMRALVHDDALHADLAARSRQRVDNFSWERAARETLSVFEQAIETHEPRAYRHRARGESLGR